MNKFEYMELRENLLRQVEEQAALFKEQGLIDEAGLLDSLHYLADKAPTLLLECSQYCPAVTVTAFIHGCLSSGKTKEELPQLIKINLCCWGFPNPNNPQKGVQ